MMRVAAWQYPIERHASFAAWAAKIDGAVADAARREASLLVAPEYAAMELTALLAPDEQATLQTQIAALQRLLPDHDAVYREAATRHGVAIVAGSFPVRAADGRYHNRALVIGPSGATAAVEKLQMTRFEHELWGIAAGRGQVIVELGDLRLGVAICYDAEFPLLVRRLAAAGANAIAVPSCTDGLAGYHRVRIAAQARALENQCYVVQAPTVGLAPWSIALDENVGAAGIFTPADRGFPDDGILTLGPLNAPHLLVADLDLPRVAAVRADGQVLGHRDWDAPAHVADAAVDRICIT
ncbi:MAG: carbon-nitrogen hydrolase family protein [Deltaproteobacteria bacterium]|nr:carbon-nitrogen hydrolase family protein [Deltaproteobacteria bacterium]